MTRQSKSRIAILVFLGGVVLTGCSDEKPLVEPNPYKPQTSQANVLYNLDVAYTMKNKEAYTQLLADDFRFYFDSNTRTLKNLPEFWNRFEDSTGTTLSLFASQKIGEIWLTLTVPPVADSLSEPGRERWTRLLVLADLDVDQKPDAWNPEGITLRMSQQQQSFYFRKGRSAADTLASSPTSQKYFLVEWRDHGASSAKPSGTALLVENTTWGSIKSLYSSK